MRRFADLRARAGPRGARRRHGARGVVLRALDRDLLHQRARRGRDRRRALRLRRQLGRALVRAHQLRRGRRLDGGRAVGAGRGKACDDALALRLPRRHDGRQRAVAAPRRARRRRVRARRRPAAHAALWPRSGNRDLRRARDHARTSSATTRRSARAQRLLVGAGDDGHAAGGDRCHRRDRRSPSSTR